MVRITSVRIWVSPGKLRLPGSSKLPPSCHKTHTWALSARLHETISYAARLQAEDTTQRRSITVDGHMSLSSKAPFTGVEFHSSVRCKRQMAFFCIEPRTLDLRIDMNPLNWSSSIMLVSAHSDDQSLSLNTFTPCDWNPCSMTDMRKPL